MADRVEIYRDEFIKIYSLDSDVYIETLKKGFPLSKMSSIFASHPEIEILGFNFIKDAIASADRPPVRFGKLKERIAVSLSDNNLNATVTFYVNDNELTLSNRENLIREVMVRLKQEKVIFGLNADSLSGKLVCGKPYVVAQGVSPANGRDAIIKSLISQSSDKKPEIVENGKINYYEVTLINKVNAGDWLGERIESADGIPGKSVKGEVILPTKGKTAPLLYDAATVEEVKMEDKTVLKARIGGALDFVNDKITILKCVEVEDVNFSTGNIKFDGFVVIKGTVADGFSVEATKDIEINSPMGLGNIKKIESTEGSVFIKGGLASKGKAEIRASRDVFTKFIDNCSIVAGGTVHIGFSCINSFIEASEVVIDSSQGQILGGSVKAKYRVVSPVIGSEMEKRTIIEIKGFNRDSLMQKLNQISDKLNSLKKEQQDLKRTLSGADKSKMDTLRLKQFNNDLQRLSQMSDQIKDLESQKKNFSSYLKTRGEGEVSVTKKLYPNCLIMIKGQRLEIAKAANGTTIFMKDGEIIQA